MTILDLSFSVFSSGISVFTGIKNIQVFCFFMICMIVEFSSELERETVFLDLLRWADPGNFCSGIFSEILTPWKPCFDSSGLLNTAQVVRTCPVVSLVWQVTPSGAVTGSVPALCVHTHLQLWLSGPVQKDSASSSSFSLWATKEFVNY